MNFKNKALFSLLMIAGLVGTVAQAEIKLNVDESLEARRFKYEELKVIARLFNSHLRSFKQKSEECAFLGTESSYGQKKCEDKLKEFGNLKRIARNGKKIWIDMRKTEKDIADDLFTQIANQLSENANQLSEDENELAEVFAQQEEE